jgi:membrane protease YdiL (CAAX protease family)
VTPEDHEDQLPRWGLGDVGLGFVLAEVAAAVVAVVVLGILGYTQADKVPLWLETVLEIPLWAFLVGVPVVASQRKGNGPVRDLGWRMQWGDIPLGVAAGLAGQILLVPIVYWPIFKILGHSENVSKVAEQMTNKVHGPADTVLIFLLVGIGAPLAEELFFRGLTQRSFLKLRDDGDNAVVRLLARTNPWSAIVLTAAFFAATHFQLLQFAGLFAFGLVLGVLAWRTGRLGPSIWAHLTFNVLAAATLVWKL